MIFTTVVLLFLLSLCSCLEATGGGWTLTSNNEVVELTESSIYEAINRPDTKLWLVVFYAPWCQHSQEFLSTLDDVAPTLKGEMAIGRVDCSIDLSLCSEEQHNIRFYPTVKWYRDGTYHNYDQGGRGHDDIISFAKMMNGPVMKRMDDYHEILGSKFLNASILSNSAVFVFYNPNPALKSSSLDSHDNNNTSLSSSLNDTNNTNQNEEGQVNLLKAAREYQATNLFIHLETNEKNEEWIQKFLSYPLSSSLSLDSNSSTKNNKMNRHILMKLEKDDSPEIFDLNWTYDSLSKYIHRNREVMVPFVTDETIQYYGSRDTKKYLAIAIVDSSSIIGASSSTSDSSGSSNIDGNMMYIDADNENGIGTGIDIDAGSMEFLSNFRQLASSCSSQMKTQYQFIWMIHDRNKKRTTIWKKFKKRFWKYGNKRGSANKKRNTEEGFLNKFPIEDPKSSPHQLLVLDYPHEIYWTTNSKTVNIENSIPYDSFSISDMERFLNDIQSANVLSTHLNVASVHQNDATIKGLMWLESHRWVLHINLLLFILSLIMLIPSSTGRMYDVVEIYFWCRCVDSLLCYLGLMELEEEGKQEENNDKKEKVD